MNFCEAFDYMKNSNQVIIANTYNGMNLKLSSECFEIIQYGVDNKLTVGQLIECLEDEGDREYFKRLLLYAYDGNILVDDDYTEKSAIDIQITNRCNLKCRHCCVDASGCSGNEVLSTNEWKEIFDKINKNPSAITISGGEPMVRKDFLELSEHLRSVTEASLLLSTNGTLITSENVKKICDLYDDFSISLDGVDEESVSAIRGKCVFDKVIKSIKLIKNADPEKNISLSMVMSSSNCENEQRFIDLCNELEVKPIVRNYDLLGRAKENIDLIPSEKMITADRKILIPEDGHFYPDKMNVCTSCRAGRRRMAINYDGKIYPCITLIKDEFCMGDIHNINSLKDYINNGLALESEGLQYFYNNYKNSTCNDCKSCIVKLFCQNCQLYSYLMKKADNYKEMCHITKKELSIIWN